MVLVGAPGAVTVIVPVLWAVPVLAVAFMVKFPLLVPLDGETVSQEVALLDAVHPRLEVTVTDTLLAVDGGPQVV